MVMVTPYIVRAVAQKELSRPDDGFAEPVRSRRRAARQLQSHLRRARRRRPSGRQRAITANTASSSIERQRTMTMTSFQFGDRSRRCDVRVALAALSATAGRLQATPRRCSRPITRTTTASAIRSRCRKATSTVDSLHRQQARRPDADRSAPTSLAFAQCLAARSDRRHRHRDAASDAPNERAAADALREVRAILAAAGVPPQAVSMRAYRPAAGRLASIKLSYPRIGGRGRPMRTVAAGHRPVGRTRSTVDNRPYWNFGCASPAQSRRHGRRSGRPRAAARRDARLTRRGATAVIDKYRKGEPPSGDLCRTTKKARSATSAQ